MSTDDRRRRPRRGDAPTERSGRQSPSQSRRAGGTKAGASKRRPEPRRNPRLEAAGSATGAIIRPVRQHRKVDPAEARRPRRHPDKVASIGEARAHRRLRDSAPPPTSPKLRDRRRITTTKPALSSRFGVGRPRLRLRLTLGVLLLILVSVMAKVGWIQSGQGDDLRAAAASVWERSRVLPAQRGAIFDRNGAELALSVPAATVVVNPMQIEDPAGVANALGAILSLSPERVEQLTTKMTEGAHSVGFLYVARQIEPKLAEQIDELGITGVSTYAEDRRMIPGGNVGLSILGKTDIDGNGISGLELQLDETLKGTPGERTREIAQGGQSIAGSEVVTAPVPGTDYVTSVDLSVQYAAEQALIRHVTASGSARGQVVIMKTNGDLLAMASVERADTGYVEVSNGNWAAVGAYEPGSVGKVITVAGALNDGKVTESTTWDVPDTYDCTDNPNDGILSDSHSHAALPLSVRRILADSSNVGTIMISKTLGYERLYDYLTAFGLGSVTPLDFPSESAGILKPWQQWEGTERCTVSYGHGFASTPIQMTAAVNVIANDGVYASPRLVTATISPDGTRNDLEPGPTHGVLTPETATTMQSMMKEVVCDGTADKAQVPGLSVAGKTGTSYKAQADGTYYNAEGKRDYYVSFVGFFPAEDPQVTILVAIDDPQSGTSGGQTAAPLFQELVPTIVTEFGIQPPPGSNGCEG